MTKKIWSRWITALLMLFLLIGCSVMTPYVIPDGQPTAFVRFKRMGDYVTYFRTINPTTCPAPTVNNLALFGWPHPGQLSEFRMIGSSDKPSADQFERMVAAGEPTLIFAGSDKAATSVYDPGYICTLGMQIIFKPDHHYEVEYELGRSACRINAWELKADGSDIRREPVMIAKSFPAKSTKDLCR